MNSHKRSRTVIFGLLIVMVFSTIGCATINTLPFIATATPYPTYTPFPTFTPPPPTATPVPERWSVKVISTTKAQTFGNWFLTEDKKAEIIIVTIEYTYMGQEMTEFYPMSVVLLFPDGSTYPGFGITAFYYQPESNVNVRNFMKEGATLTFIKPGQTKTEKFGWELLSSGDLKFRILFPETKPIDITIEN